MERVVILGSGGAGKSTLASQLGQLFKIEVIHLDALYWKPGWIPTPQDEWSAVIRSLVQRERWIIDGNYGGSEVEPRLQHADTVIFLDFNRVVCLWRILKRYFQYAGRTRPDLAPGCPEKLSWDFMKWVWEYPNRSRFQILSKIKEHQEGRRIIILRNPKEAAAFLQEMRRPGLN